MTPVQSESYLQTMALAKHKMARDPFRTHDEQVKELRTLTADTYLAGMRFSEKHARAFGFKVGVGAGFAACGFLTVVVRWLM